MHQMMETGVKVAQFQRLNMFPNQVASK